MLDKMSREIDDAQSDTHKLVQDGDALAVDSGSPRAGEAKPADPPSPPPLLRSALMPTPQLRVVHLGPDGTEETGSQDEQAPRLSLTNASLGRQPAPRLPPRVSAAPEHAKHAPDASPAQPTHSESGDPPAAPKQATLPPKPPDARPPINDEDDEHIVPVDEDNEHLVGGDQR
jgi:hypothetical protein